MSPRSIHETSAAQVIEQAYTAADDAERRWPHNERVLCDERIEARLLDALVGPSPTEAWQDVQPGEVTLLWPATGTATPCPPEAEVAGLARGLVPKFGQCDRCQAASRPIYGGLLVAMGARLIGLSLCGWCAYDLTIAGYEPVWTFHPDKEMP